MKLPFLQRLRGKRDDAPRANVKREAPAEPKAKRTRRARGPRLSLGVGRFVALVCCTVVLTGLGLFQVNRQYEQIRLGYAIDEDLFEHRRLMEMQKRLRLSLASFNDPAAVKAFAEDELGMRSPGLNDEFFVPNPSDGPRPDQRFGGFYSGGQR